MLEVLLVLLVGFIIFVSTGIRIVSQGEEWVVERLGKFNRILLPGLNMIIPFVESVREKVSTRDIILDVPQQEVITKDNAVILSNAVAFIKITDPKNSVYGVENVKLATVNLITTTLRAIIGEMSLDQALSSREQIKLKLKTSIIDDIMDWGITVKSVEIQDIKPSHTMQIAMEKQASAEREKRSTISIAEGNKSAMILNAEGELEASKKQAEAQIELAKASNESIKLVTEALKNNELPALFLLGERYIDNLNKLSSSDNSKIILLPSDILSAIKGLLGK